MYKILHQKVYFRGLFFDQGQGAANGQTTLGMIIILVKAAVIHPASAPYVDHHRDRQASADAPSLHLLARWDGSRGRAPFATSVF